MRQLTIEDKQKYLDEHFPFEEVPAVTDKMLCIHCGVEFFVGYYKVYVTADGFEMICCPNAPDCNGTVIDWFPPEGD